MGKPDAQEQSGAIEPEPTVEVSPATLLLLRQIAREMDCTVEAVLEEAIREYALNT